MTKPNPFRHAKIYLARDLYDAKIDNKMFTVQGALEWALMHRPSKDLMRKALNHFKKMVHPQLSERAWLLHNVPDFRVPSVQDMQDYRHRWLDHMAKQWDEREIK